MWTRSGRLFSVDFWKRVSELLQGTISRFISFLSSPSTRVLSLYLLLGPCRPSSNSDTCTVRCLSPQHLLPCQSSLSLLLYMVSPNILAKKVLRSRLYSSFCCFVKDCWEWSSASSGLCLPWEKERWRARAEQWERGAVSSNYLLCLLMSNNFQQFIFLHNKKRILSWRWTNLVS